MKYLLSLFLIFTVVSCAHHDNKVKHHHHEAKYQKKCAYTLAKHGKEVSGKKEFSLKHAGAVYYFSSEANLNAFKKDIKENVKRANARWRELGHGHER